MHVLICALHRPSKPTGVCRYAANLAQCLASCNEVTKVTLVIGAWQESYFNKSFKLLSKKINLISIDIKNTSSSRNIWFLLTLPKIAKQLDADIVHLSFPLPFIRQLFGCPVIATIHDLYPYEFPENFGYPNVIFNQLFLKLCINNSDGLSCVSKTTLESLQQYFNKIDSQKITTVIYNQADFSNINNKIPSYFKNSVNNSPFLLAVAQHRKNKNLDIIIKSYNSLKANNQIHESTKLIIVGSSGPETENLKHLISASPKANVEMLTSIDDEELCWLYKNCQLLVVPSTTEGFCLPLAEALSVGAKVVCSDIPILREIGNSSCKYFKLEGDRIYNLSQAIIDSLAEPASQIIKADNRFSKKLLLRQYINLYSHIKSLN